MKPNAVPDAALLLAAIALATLAASFLWLAPALLHRAIQCRRVRAAARGGRCRIAITYDDGPGPTLTPQLLDLLAQHHAPATFFMLGRRAGVSPDTARRVASAGHEVATHSKEHLHAWKVAPWRAVRDLTDEAWAREILGQSRTLLRPPYGKMTLATWLATLLRGRRIAWWTIDSGDTWATLPAPKEVARRVIEAGGGIVLLHDFDREQSTGTANDRHAFVLAATRAILEDGAKAGFTFCTCSAMLRRPETDPR